MTDNEIKWYITLKIGSSISRTRIITDKYLYGVLKKKYDTHNIEYIMKKLHNLGFKILGNPTRDIYLDYISEAKLERKYGKRQKENEIRRKGIIKNCHRENSCRISI